MDKIRNEVRTMKEKELETVPGYGNIVETGGMPASDWDHIAGDIDNANHFCDIESEYFYLNVFNKSILSAAYRRRNS